MRINPNTVTAMLTISRAFSKNGKNQKYAVAIRSGTIKMAKMEATMKARSKDRKFPPENTTTTAD